MSNFKEEFLALDTPEAQIKALACASAETAALLCNDDAFLKIVSALRRDNLELWEKYSKLAAAKRDTLLDEESEGPIDL